MTLSQKLMIFALCCLVGCAGGLYLSRKASERQVYYKELTDFCRHFISYVSFRSERLNDIIDKFHGESALLKSQLEVKKDGEADCPKGFLDDREYNEALGFFSKLGKFDEQTQIEEVKNDMQVFQEKYEAIKKVNAVKRPMRIKLGLLFGALVGVLLM